LGVQSVAALRGTNGEHKEKKKIIMPPPVVLTAAQGILAAVAE
jgi:hypothetical protein